MVIYVVMYTQGGDKEWCVRKQLQLLTVMQ